MNYLESLGDEATLSLRLRLLLNVARGLAYLHSFTSPVLHGDLKGANVLVDKRGIAMLTDFGLSSIFEDIVGSAHLSGSEGCSVRWMAPELVCIMGDYSGVHSTPASDVYSFGSTMLEVLTGRLPYPHCQRDVQVVMDICRGVRHQWQDYCGKVPKSVWGFMEGMWREAAELRPRSEELVEELAWHYDQALVLEKSR